MLDLRNLYQQIQDIESMLKDVLAGAMPVSPSATHSGRSARSSGGGSSTSSEGGGGGGGGQLRGVTVGGRRLHQQTFSGGGAAGGGAAAGQDWQAGLLQYSDGDSPHGAAAPAAAAEEPPAQVRAGAGGILDRAGAGGWGGRGGAACLAGMARRPCLWHIAELPPIATTLPPPQLPPSRCCPAVTAQLVPSAHCLQQHIAAHVPGEQDDEEVIEIHSDGDGDGENRGGGP